MLDRLERCRERTGWRRGGYRVSTTAVVMTPAIRRTRAAVRSAAWGLNA